MELQLPTKFVDTVTRVFGDQGRVWLTHLPDILNQCRKRWGLRVGDPCPNMSMNYIEFTTTSSGEAVALKVGVPHRELYTEIEALRLFDAKGSVGFVDADLELGAFLMQHVQPGTMLWQLGNNMQETQIAADVIAKRAVPVPKTHAFPSYAEWLERAFRLTRTEWDPQCLMPRNLIDKAENAFAEIERTKTANVVLHGDLHHENIILDEHAGWLMIDPKGVIGAPCLEVGRYLHNQLPIDDARRRVAMTLERIDIFSSALGYPKETIAASGLVDCVLSHCWCFEDEALGADWHAGLELAQLFCRVMKI